MQLNSLQIVLLLECLLVQPGSKDWQGRRIFDFCPRPLESAIVVSQRIRGQHDGQLQLDRLLQVARSHDELQRTKGN